MIRYCKPKIVEIYYNKNRKNIDEIYAEQSLKYKNLELIIFNGMLYNGNYTPVNMHLKIHNNVVAVDPKYTYWGYGWDDNKANVELIRDYISVDNYVCGNCLLRYGKEEDLYYNKDQLGGDRPRTAWGIKADGTYVIYCETKIGRTLEELQLYMKELGCDSAISFDGGGSSQYKDGNSENRVYSTDLYNKNIKKERIVLTLFCMWVDKSEIYNPPTKNHLICIDAGHGYNTSGKRCLKSLDENETREWWLNQRISNYIQNTLKGYNCTTMRTDDVTGAINVSLSSRVDQANKADADLFISIHHNGGINGGNGGGIVIFTAERCSATSTQLAKLVCEKSLQKTGLKGNRYSNLDKEDFYVIKYTDMPAILCEFGFMDSSTDVPIILTEDYSKKCAEAIVESVIEILNIDQIEVKKKLFKLSLKEQNIGIFSIKENVDNIINTLNELNIKTIVEEI